MTVSSDDISQNNPNQDFGSGTRSRFSGAIRCQPIVKDKRWFVLDGGCGALAGTSEFRESWQALY